MAEAEADERGEVVRGGGVHGGGEPHRRRRGVQHVAERLGRPLGAHRHARRRAGRRVRHGGRHRAAAEARAEPREVAAQVGEGGRAGALGGAGGDHAVERALAVDRDLHRRRRGRRHDGVQHHRAHAAREEARVDERRARAVRRAVQVHPRVAERGAQGVEVAHGVGRRVAREVGAAREAVAAGVERRGLEEVRGEPREQRVVARGGRHDHVAPQRVGAAGAALVHEHDVARPAQRLVRFGRQLGELRRSLPRPAREHVQGR